MTVDAAKHDDEIIVGVTDTVPTEEAEKKPSKTKKMEEPEKAEEKLSRKNEKGLETPEESQKEVTVYDLPGVGAATAEKLKEAGYDSVMSVAVASLGKLVEDSGVSESVARKMIQAARDSLKMGFISGSDRKPVIRHTSWWGFRDRIYCGVLW
jgi:predicted flap endonuclease-1-like 5' DNA nuclease